MKIFLLFFVQLALTEHAKAQIESAGQSIISISVKVNISN